LFLRRINLFAERKYVQMDLIYAVDWFFVLGQGDDPVSGLFQDFNRPLIVLAAERQRG